MKRAWRNASENSWCQISALISPWTRSHPFHVQQEDVSAEGRPWLVETRFRNNAALTSAADPQPLVALHKSRGNRAKLESENTPLVVAVYISQVQPWTMGSLITGDVDWVG